MPDSPTPHHSLSSADAHAAATKATNGRDAIEARCVKVTEWRWASYRRCFPMTRSELTFIKVLLEHKCLTIG
jgi:hypothetical protein